jgi:hypothetical protein
MMKITACAAVGFVLLAGVPCAVAQVLGAQSSTAPQERSRRDLTSQVNLVAGVDRDQTSGVTDHLPASGSSQYIVGFGDASLDYFSGIATRYVNLGSRTYAYRYREAEGTAYGGDVSGGVRTPLGGRADVTVSQTVQFRPFYSIGSFSALEGELGQVSPDLNPTNSVSSRARSLDLQSSARLGRDWSRRFRSEAGYSFGRTTYDTASAFDTLTQRGFASMSRGLGRTSGLRASYSLVGDTYTLHDGGQSSMTNHTIDVGLEHRRNLSRSRRVTFGYGSGAIHVLTEDPTTHGTVQYWTPAGFGMVRLDLGRSWNVSADYRRDVTPLQGAVPEPFINNATTLRAGGTIARRFELVLMAAHSTGEAGGGGAGRQTSYVGASQLNVLVAPGLSALFSFNHYDYRLNNAAGATLGVPPAWQTTTLNAGLTWTLPIIGGGRGRTRTLSN